MPNMQVQSLGREDSWENEITTHSKYSALGNFMNRGAWQATVHGDSKSRTTLKRLTHTHIHTQANTLWAKNDENLNSCRKRSKQDGTNIGFPGGSLVKRIHLQCRRPGLIPGSGRPPGEGNGNPLQYSYLGNPMGRGAWQATVHGVTKSWTWLSD